MTPQSPGGVVVYDVVDETLTEVASTDNFTFISQFSTCLKSRNGKIATVV